MQEKKFIPVIYSRGLIGSCLSATSTCSELASNGNIVFALNHDDGIWDVLTFKPELTNKYLNMRVQECIKLRNLLEDKSFIKNIIGSSIDFDLERITVIGESFGGITAQECCRIDKRFCYFSMLDPGIQFLEMDKLKQGIPNSVDLLLESETVDALALQFKITYKNTEFATSAKEVGSHVFVL